jgi:hypothetical protein
MENGVRPFAGTLPERTQIRRVAAILEAIVAALLRFWRQIWDGTNEPDRAQEGQHEARPRVGDSVTARSHFTADGGYVEHNGVLFWARCAPEYGGSPPTPGMRCLVSIVERGGTNLIALVVIGVENG